MEISHSLPLLGGLSPAAFMRRFWQKKPLLVRQAQPDVTPPLARAALFELAARPEVVSRLVLHDGQQDWRLRHGPLNRRALPPLGRPGWSLLVQGVDLHHEAARAVLEDFRFLPDARLDDLMISYASDGGGVGPHFDSYDVFLLQVSGRRRWSYGRQRDLSLREGLPLKILQHFEPEHSAVLEPGDMLYLPPRYAHEGTAVGGDCMTCSIGLRAPSAGELTADLLARLAVAADEADEGALPQPPQPHYRDPGQGAVATPGAIPQALQDYARRALRRALSDEGAIDRALGESLTEPKAQVWFNAGEAPPLPWCGLRLDRRSRMLYDAKHIYINGEGLRASGRDAVLMRRLSDQRCLNAAELGRASDAALELLQQWCEAGWVHVNRR